jgi:hypothetical protein
MKPEYCVRKIDDPKFPWGLYEGHILIGKFEDENVARNIMRAFQA